MRPVLKVIAAVTWLTGADIAREGDSDLCPRRSWRLGMLNFGTELATARDEGRPESCMTAEHFGGGDQSQAENIEVFRKKAGGFRDWQEKERSEDAMSSGSIQKSELMVPG